MSWHDLARLGVTVRPITQPIVGNQGYGFWKGSPFDAPLSSTLQTLERELRHLGAERIILELDLEDRHIRLDGFPRADARTATPAVALSFDSPYGPLRYATAEFDPWQANLRAIALALEALRKVDRYGVSKRGEQYRGWRELPTGTDPADAIQTREQALAIIATASGYDLTGTSVDSAVRAALRRTHPDQGGDPTEFRKVMKAREVLGV